MSFDFYNYEKRIRIISKHFILVCLKILDLPMNFKFSETFKIFSVVFNENSQNFYLIGNLWEVF